jgi:hypothetical protein
MLLGDRSATLRARGHRLNEELVTEPRSLDHFRHVFEELTGLQICRLPSVFVRAGKLRARGVGI